MDNPGYHLSNDGTYWIANEVLFGCSICGYITYVFEKDYYFCTFRCPNCKYNILERVEKLVFAFDEVKPNG